MDATGLWFSKLENNYSADYGQFRWTDEQRIWDWNKLTTVELVKTKDGAKRLILRRKGDVYASHGREDEPKEDKPKPNATLRYMLGIDICEGGGPKDIVCDYYTARIYDHYEDQWNLVGPKERFSFQICDNAWLWQWADEDEKIKEVHRYIKNSINDFDNEAIVYTNKFNLHVDDNPELKPVIYQPAVDAMKNFIREIHCSKKPAANGKNEVEVTLVFDNEELRKHKILNKIYEFVRLAKYRRLNDIESFIIIQNPDDDKASGLRFRGIYSGDNGLEEDTIHGEPEDNLPPHRVKYYADKSEADTFNHPIIFINTSNHSMAEYDTNPALWKWEYVPWIKDMPLKDGTDDRETIEKKYNKGLGLFTKKLLNLLK